MTLEGLPVRHSARVVLIDALDRVLLIEHVVDNPRDAGHETVWVPPGGGLEAGEGLVEAAMRELWEETGLRLPELGPLLWTHRSTFAASGTLMTFVEHFFMARVTVHDPADHVNPDELERTIIRGLRWWSRPDIASSSQLFAPRALGLLLRPILIGDYPLTPIEIDDG